VVVVIVRAETAVLFFGAQVELLAMQTCDNCSGTAACVERESELRHNLQHLLNCYLFYKQGIANKQ